MATSLTPPLTLVIGNKNYSSWSLRPWLFLRYHDIDFNEVRIPLYVPESKATLLSYSPAGRVPVLVDGDLRIWESLATLEYLAERFPATAAWPVERAARAHARSIAAEMHAGFAALRKTCGMNLRRRYAFEALPAEVEADADRVRTIWTECRERHRGEGPFLFGPFSIADAMYAPVVWRFDGYSLPIEGLARGYVDHMLALPAMQAWREAALAEVEVLPQFERK